MSGIGNSGCRCIANRCPIQRIPKIAGPGFRTRARSVPLDAKREFARHFPYTAGVFPLKRVG
jgi:hypothetical protein